MWYYRSIPGALLLFLVTSLLGQNAEQDTLAPGNHIQIDRAKRTIIEKQDTSEVIYLTGQIELSQDSLYMYCDSARVVDKTQMIAIGNVILQQSDTLQVFADTLTYDGEDRFAILKGRVVLEQGQDQLWTEVLTYDLDRKMASYHQGATLINDSTQLSSKRGYYFTDIELAQFIDSVVVVGNAFTLKADSLNYHSPSQTADFIGPTIIQQEGSKIYCEDGYFLIGERRGEFRQNAQYLGRNKRAVADTIRYSSATETVELIGRAHYIEDDQDVRADYIRYHEPTGYTTLIGHAVYRDSMRFMTGDTIYYDRTTEEFLSNGRTTMDEKGRILIADQVRFNEGTEEGIAYGSVVFRDTASNYEIRSDSAYYNRTTNFVKAFGRSRPLFKTDIEGDTLYLVADTLLFFSEVDSQVVLQVDTSLDTLTSIRIDTVDRLTAFHDVRIFKSDLQARCDSLVFLSSDSLFRLLRNPVVWSDTSQFIADTIFMAMRNEKIDRFILIDNSFIISILYNYYFNQVKGRAVTAFFKDDALDLMTVEGNAESVYYVRDEEEAFIGVNRVLCSEMVLEFANEEIDQIRFINQPKSKMTPMSKVNHSALRLEGFRWMENIRPKSVQDL